MERILTRIGVEVQDGIDRLRLLGVAVDIGKSHHEACLGSTDRVVRRRLVFANTRDGLHRLEAAIAKAAKRIRAEVVVVTSDNPRTEDPESIIDDVVAGMAGWAVERIADRREAIFHALAGARRGDVVLLAGKGHERYQVIGTESRPFDERQVVRQCLAELGGGA